MTDKITAEQASMRAIAIRFNMTKEQREYVSGIESAYEARIAQLYDEMNYLNNQLRQALTAPRVPEWLIEMSNQMRTQDNRCTSHPFWQVRCKRTLPTEQGYNEIGYEVCGDDGVVYRSGQPTDVLLEHLIDEHEEWCKAWAEDNHPDDPWQSAVEQWFDGDSEELPYGLRKVYIQEAEEVVSTHLTEADAMAFIKRKQHDYPPLYTYVESAYWAPQLRMLQDWIIGLAAAPAPADNGDQP